MISDAGIKVHHLGDLVTELQNHEFMIKNAAGADLVNLVKFDYRKTST
jgi:hypothetical protein